MQKEEELKIVAARRIGKTHGLAMHLETIMHAQAPDPYWRAKTSNPFVRKKDFRCKNKFAK